VAETTGVYRTERSHSLISVVQFAKPRLDGFPPIRLVEGPLLGKATDQLSLPSENDTATA
jgi:hypothetical protein